MPFYDVDTATPCNKRGPNYKYKYSYLLPTMPRETPQLLNELMVEMNRFLETSDYNLTLHKLTSHLIDLSTTFLQFSLRIWTYIRH